MFRRHKKSVGIILGVTLLLSACNFPLSGGSEEDEANALATAVAMTIQAMENQPLPTDTPAPQSTATGMPTVTAQPTNTVSGPPPATPQPCDKAALAAETIPDDSEFGPGQSFTKSWTMRNVGTCTWNTDYKLKFASGDAMGGPASVNLTSSVAPDQQIKIEVPLKAPSSAGTYTGYWQLTNSEGENFSQVFVRIKVITGPFAVTSLYTNLSDKDPDSCLYDLSYEIYIQTSSAGTVTYKVEQDDVAGPSKSLNFDAAGTKTLEAEWNDLPEGDHKVRVYIDQPNHQWFGPFNFHVECP